MVLSTIPVRDVVPAGCPIYWYRSELVRCASEVVCTEASAVNKSSISKVEGERIRPWTQSADRLQPPTPAFLASLSHVNSTRQTTTSKRTNKPRPTTFASSSTNTTTYHQNSHQHFLPTCLSVVYAPAWSAPSSNPAPNSSPAAARTAKSSLRCVTAPTSYRTVPAPFSRA